MTDTAGAVDSGGPTPSAVLWSIGAIADRDSISKQAVSKKVKALAEDHGLEVTRDARGRIATVNVAAYDHLREQFGDASKAQAPPRAGELPLGSDAAAGIKPRASGDSRDEADRQRAWIDAERARLRLGEETKELLRAASVDDAVDACGAEIARIINRVLQSADDIAASVGRDGVHGLRVLLKSIAHKQCIDVANALAAIAADAPEQEEPRAATTGE